MGFQDGVFCIKKTLYFHCDIIAEIEGHRLERSSQEIQAQNGPGSLGSETRGNEFLESA